MEEGDLWRVRTPNDGGFDYLRVRKDDVEPLIGKDGKQVSGLCMPFGGGGVYSRPEVGPDGTVRIKRFLITVSCKDGKSYSTTKPLN